MPLKTRLATPDPINDHASTCSALTDAAPAAGDAHHPASEAEDDEVVRPSNSPTDNAAMNDINPEAAVSDRVEAAAFARDRHVDEPAAKGREEIGVPLNSKPFLKSCVTACRGLTGST